MARRLANKKRLPTANVIRNKNFFQDHQDKIQTYQHKIKDEKYIKDAINKIAEELTYFLLK